MVALAFMLMLNLTVLAMLVSGAWSAGDEPAYAGAWQWQASEPASAQDAGRAALVEHRAIAEPVRVARPAIKPVKEQEPTQSPHGREPGARSSPHVTPPPPTTTSDRAAVSPAPPPGTADPSPAERDEPPLEFFGVPIE